MLLRGIAPGSWLFICSCSQLDSGLLLLVSPSRAEEEDLQRSRLSVRRGGGGGGGGRLSAEDLQRLREQQALADQVSWVEGTA